MSGARPAAIVRQLGDAGGTDAELLARFAAAGDGAAFAELVRRHGPLVLGVCRRAAGHPQDAEDAFQATFLVLAQKAGSLRPGVALGSWLYGVASRVAWRARRGAARRRRREVAVPNVPEAPMRPDLPADPGLTAVLDEELAALPAHYRDAIVLCDLQEASREAAAAALGVPVGTLSSRLTNGRKKLAARLARRGVALPAAALPLTLADAGAAAVPSELLVRTCRLVLDYAAGGAVPGRVAHLLRGGMSMRRTFVACVAGLAAVGGAVFAALPVAAPPVAGQPPPPKVVKAPDPPERKDEPKPKEETKPAEKAVFATAPRLQRSLDLDVGGSIAVMWNTTGTHLAVVGRPERQPGKKTVPTLALYDVTNECAVLTPIANGDELVALAPDGRGFTTALREYHLVSGKHHLKRWVVAEKQGAANEVKNASVPPDAVIGRDGVWRWIRAGRVTPLDGSVSHEYSFAPDGRTYRTAVWRDAPDGASGGHEVVEVDSLTGKQSGALFEIAPGPFALSPDGKRVAVGDKDLGRVAVYAADGGAKLCEHASVDDPRSGQAPHSGSPSMVFSPDGRRLVLARGIGRATVIDADTGQPLPALEGAERVRVYPDTGCFTRDGRLLASLCDSYRVTTTARPVGGGKEAKQESWEPRGATLAVWDTQTGKKLKTWKADGVRLAFCPTRPLLAVVEGNGETEVRVGFWDFAAEGGKRRP